MTVTAPATLTAVGVESPSSAGQTTATTSIGVVHLGNVASKFKNDVAQDEYDLRYIVSLG